MKHWHHRTGWSGQLALTLLLAVGLSVPYCLAATDATSSVLTTESAEQQSANATDSATSMQKASVEIDVAAQQPEPFPTYVAKLISIAKERDPLLQKSQKSVKHFNSNASKFAYRANDALNSIFSFKGVSSSSQAGDVILNEKLKVNSRGAAGLANQNVIDKLELSITTALLEIANGLGSSNPTSAALQVEEGKNDLAALVGEEEASKAIEAIKALPPKVNESPELTVKQARLRMELGLKSALLADPVMEDVTSDVHRYNTHSKPVLAAHRFARTSLSIASLAPNIAGPASQAVLFAYVVMSGGSETSKVMKELYMGKRLERRADAITEQLHLVFDNYQLGSLSKNPTLAVCAEKLLTRLTGEKPCDQLLHTSEFTELIAAQTQAEAEARKRHHIDDVAQGGANKDQKTSKVSAKHTPHKVAKHDTDTPSDTANSTSTDATKEAVKQAANDNSQDALKQTANDNAQDAAKQTANDDSQDVAKQAAANVAQEKSENETLTVTVSGAATH